MRALDAFALTLLIGVLCASPATGQQLSSSAMDAAVAGHESAVDQQRAQLDELLSRPQVQDLARDRGIDMGRVASIAAGLSDGEVRGIAPLVAKAASAPLQDGLGSVTISVAAVIIILLVLILVT